ncbi:MULTISPECIES: hypothetical protein [Elizabethkingia]|uniref:hypothetical protein n=1 Tax=Elizabethkingia TaxID=308865 RepID=UPI0038920D84
MKQKIYLSLTDNDIKVLKAFVETKGSDDLKSLLKLQIEKEDQDSYIRHNAYLALSDMSGFKTEDFNDNSHLTYDLGLRLYHKRALKNYFQKIVNDLKSAKLITVKECENLEKVKDCLELIKSKL